MVKFSIIALLLITVFSCSNPSKDFKSVSKTDTTKKEMNDFKILKSGVFWNELDEGKFDVVKFKDETIDSIDNYFGLYILKNNAIVYLKVSKDELGESNSAMDSIYGSIDKYILKEKRIKIPINTLSDHFNDYFSSPNLVNDKLYYWGLESIDSNGTYNIYACELNLINKSKTKFFLFKDKILTDFRGYFPEPTIKNNIITYTLENEKNWTFSKDFKPLK